MLTLTKPIFSLFQTPPRVLYFDAHLGIGGPIVRDKLWFYVSGGFIQGDTEYLFKGPRESEQIPKGFGKLTFQAGKNDRLSAFAEYEFFQVFNRGFSVYRPVDCHLLRCRTGTSGGPQLAPYFHGEHLC